MQYYIFNIGGPYTDRWWDRNRSMGIISTGFGNTSGDEGEQILRSLRRDDWVIAYASGWGAIGAGQVGDDDTYRLAHRRELPVGWESRHRHLREVNWIHCVASLSEAVPFGKLQVLARRIQRTKSSLTSREGRRIIALLASKAGRNKLGLRDEEASFRPQEEDDRREVVQRQIRERRGQRTFRDALRKRYGDRCLITGCGILAILEAAHIKPYRGESDNHPQNGLLLRADIHTLFDLDLLGIEPKKLRARLHPCLANDTAYGKLEGQTLRCSPSQVPSQEALALRYRSFLKSAKRDRPGT